MGSLYNDTKDGRSHSSKLQDGGAKAAPLAGVSFELLVLSLGREVTAIVRHAKEHCDVTRPSADCAYCRGAGARE